MATYLVVRNGDSATSYKCNTTHTSKPYLKVKDDCYLDLTTRTSSGLQLNVKVNKRTDTFVTTTGYKGYFSCKQSTASGIKSSNGSTYNTTDYEPFVSFTSTAGWATRNTTYTRTSYNAGILSSTTALTCTSSLFNKGIYHIVNTTSTITDISSRSEVDYTVSTSTSRSSQRNSTSGYSGVSSYSTSRSSTSGYSGRTSSARTTANGYRYTTTSANRASTSGYSGQRLSNYVSAVSWSGYTRMSDLCLTKMNLYNAGYRESWADGWDRSGNVTWGNWAWSEQSGWWGEQGPYTRTLVNSTGNSWIANGQTGNAWRQCTITMVTYTRATTNVQNQLNYTANRWSAYTSENANGMASATALTRNSSYSVSTRYAAAATSAYPSDFTATVSGTVQISGYRTSAGTAGQYSNTALTRSSGYWTTLRRTSAAVGALLSTTALTRTSYYTVSTSTSRSSSSYSTYTFLTSTSIKMT